MRPTHSVTTKICQFLTGLFVLGALCKNTAVGQQSNAGNAPATASTTNSIPMPNDPSAILKAASSVNGLHGENLQPWHAKLTYEVFDDKGKQQSQGTFEEFWISDKNYEQSYSEPDFMQTDYAVNGQLLRMGQQDWPKLAESQVRNILVSPVVDMPGIPDVELGKKDIKLGNVRLICVTSTSKKVYVFKNSFCFDMNTPMLRMEVSSDGLSQVAYNSIVSFQGHFLATDIESSYKGTPRFKIHLDDVEELSDLKFSPPPEATTIAPDKITFPAPTMSSYLVSQVAPIYPTNAKLTHVEGTVLLDVAVGKDGAVSSVQYVSGPMELRQSAIDAVGKWRYRPFLFLGEPANFSGLVSIVYTLG